MEHKEKLNQIREEIDATDRQLVSLLKHRMQLSQQVAEAKKAGGIAVHDPAREEAILQRISNQAGPDFANDIRMLYAKIFSLSKARQRRCLFQNQTHPLTAEIQEALAHSGPFPRHAAVACPGPEGSDSQQAAFRMFSQPSLQYFPTFEDLFEAIEQGLCHYGVLPMENTAADSAIPVYDALIRHRCHIVRSCRMPVPHQLPGRPGATEKELRQGASRPAPVQYTRFLCISRKLEIFENAGKLSLVLELPHRPGALNDLLNRFTVLGINLTKLESRPVPDTDVQFLFTFDFEASPREPQTLQLLEELASDPQISHFTFLGAYDEN